MFTRSLSAAVRDRRRQVFRTSPRKRGWWPTALLVMVLALAGRAQTARQDADITIANSYDDAWQGGSDGWDIRLRHMQLNAADKTDGFVVFLGDSITYAPPFGQWARYGRGKTAADAAVCSWMHADIWGDGTNLSSNGWYLAACNVRANGSFTAQSGITSGQYLNGTFRLPGIDAMFTSGLANPDGRQYRDAQIAVVLLGTNDMINNGAPADLAANLTAIVGQLEAARVIPILTTLPPSFDHDVQVAAFNAAIRSCARTCNVPLIDFCAEILRRRPGTTWQHTLISGDGIHPTTIGGPSDRYDSAEDPYADNGLALSNVGYLLRGWLTVQKIAEVKAAVLDVVAGDINHDGLCDAADLTRMAHSWGLCDDDVGCDPQCDLNGDGTVNAMDMLILARHYETF